MTNGTLVIRIASSLTTFRSKLKAYAVDSNGAKVVFGFFVVSLLLNSCFILMSRGGGGPLD